MKVFVDTNVLLDVLTERDPHYSDSATIWTLVERGKVDGYISAISFTNIYYIVRRWGKLKSAQLAMSLLRDTFQVASCDAQVLNQAIDAGLKDFEDAVQYISAIRTGADCLISRNSGHFPETAECPVLTPVEFLAAYSFE